MTGLREAEACQVTMFLNRWLLGPPTALEGSPKEVRDKWEASIRADLRELRARYAHSPEACDLLAVVAVQITPSEG